MQRTYIYAINEKGKHINNDSNNKKKIKFDYKTKGMMAEIGKRTGVAILFGKIKIHGFIAWWLWRTYYLSNLPTTKKKLKVMGDWFLDLLLESDVAMIKREGRGQDKEERQRDIEEKRRGRKEANSRTR